MKIVRVESPKENAMGYILILGRICRTFYLVSMFDCHVP